MKKEKLEKIVKESKLPDKGKSQLLELINEKTAKAKIEFETLTELEENKATVSNFLDELKKEGLNFKYEISGKDFVLHLLYQGFKIKERSIIEDEKPPERRAIDPKASLKRSYLMFKTKIFNMEDKPAFKIFKTPFEFYDHFRINLMDKIIEIYTEKNDFERVLNIILKQALEKSSKEALEELYKGSLIEIEEKRDVEFRNSVFDSAKKELFFRLDSRKNLFSSEDAQKTVDNFNDFFIKKMENIYGDNEKLLLTLLEAMNKISDAKSPEEANNLIKIKFQKILEDAVRNTNPLKYIKTKIEAL